jgi:hypothetical protein
MRKKAVVVVVTYYLPVKVSLKLTKNIAKTIFGDEWDLEYMIIKLAGGDRSSDNVSDCKNVEKFESNDDSMDMAGYELALNKAPVGVVYLMINDTIFNKHPYRMISLRLRKIVNLISECPTPCVGGVINPSTDVLFNEMSPKKHVSTFLMMLNKKGADAVKNEFLHNKSHGANGDEFENYQQSDLLVWIHLNAPRNPWSWNVKESLKKDSDLLRKKSKAVVLEQAITDAIFNKGGMVVPINYGLGFKAVSRVEMFFRLIVKRVHGLFKNELRD